MTWGNRLKLVAGVLAVLLVVAAATLLFNRRQSEVLSTSAEIQASRFDVGTDYGGLVVAQYVDDGDTVTKGDRLFAIDSPILARDIKQGLIEAEPGSLAKDGTVTVRASIAGTVEDVTADVGSFAGAGTVIAAIDERDSLYTEAEFVLTPRDFSRIVDDAAVELRLPDDSLLAGTVADYSVETVEGAARVTVRIESDALVDDADGGLVQAGTPVAATLHLRDDGPLAGVTDALGDLARKVGL
ncbi:HlyD family efflux transporter periplasmic adaptor subunit [Demequina rhizosphaerae]|uniref:HlyD family efflux transporter periplasmic adaptor subunit n=1 Tax=Demequina rhizosphaerae TaxID=1638985 RepID=UPI000783B14A|nr:HlyD family efflux transporter periplasmic adaptor subunit [Demequina rhizosphaerae]